MTSRFWMPCVDAAAAEAVVVALNDPRASARGSLVGVGVSPLRAFELAEWAVARGWAGDAAVVAASAFAERARVERERPPAN